MNLFAAVGLAIVAALIAVMLRPRHPEFSLVIALITGAILLGSLLKETAPVFTRWQSLFASADVSSDYVRIVIKALGICWLTQLAADVCRDAGETALSHKVDLVGKVCLLGLSWPLWNDLLALVTGLINGEAMT